MEEYVEKAVKLLKNSDKKKLTIKLKNKNDYKKNWACLTYNKLVFAVQRKLTPSKFKNWLLSTTGLEVGDDICIPHDINFDPYFPELICVGKGCIVGGCTTLRSHTIKGKNLTLGKIIVKPRSLVGGVGTIYPGSVVNKNCILNFFSDLDSEMGEGELWGGKPGKFWKKFSEEEIEKYFKPSNGKHKKYYKEFYKRVESFVKDPEQTYFKMHYDGNRLNAGDDWWRARNVLMIYYCGIIVEIARRTPTSFLRKLLYRMMKVKFGKNVYVGKGVIFDHLYGDFNEVGDNVKIGDYTYFDNHSYTITQTVFGKNKVGNNVVIGRNAHIVCGSQIGNNVTIQPKSVVQRVVPSDVVWGGSPMAKLIQEKKKKK